MDLSGVKAAVGEQLGREQLDRESDEAHGWWRVYRMGRVYGRDYPQGGQEQWWLRWDHGDDEPVVRGPFPSRKAAVEASHDA
jgi:hypothetical protein